MAVAAAPKRPPLKDGAAGAAVPSPPNAEELVGALALEVLVVEVPNPDVVGVVAKRDAGELVLAVCLPVSNIDVVLLGAALVLAVCLPVSNIDVVLPGAALENREPCELPKELLCAV